MKQTKDIMGMPITVNVIDQWADDTMLAEVFAYFTKVDERCSTYKPDSEISKINRGLPAPQWSAEMTEIMALCEETKQATNGYFDIRCGGKLDPSGLVKGWAIYNGARILADHGCSNFYIDAGGDIQVSGRNNLGKAWQIGLRNPFNRDEVIKVIALGSGGVATSGTYIRGQHIYNPFQHDAPIEDIAALTVIGPTIYDADRFATAAFAMGRKGIEFIESLAGYEGYAIDHNQRATMTSGFERFVVTA